MIVLILITAFLALIAAYILVIVFPGLAPAARPSRWRSSSARTPAVTSALDAIIYYLGQAMGIVWLFVPKTVTITLMTLAIAIEIVVLGYKFVMWILRKIPMAGID